MKSNLRENSKASDDTGSFKCLNLPPGSRRRRSRVESDDSVIIGSSASDDGRVNSGDSGVDSGRRRNSDSSASVASESCSMCGEYRDQIQQLETMLEEAQVSLSSETGRRRQAEKDLRSEREIVRGLKRQLGKLGRAAAAAGEDRRADDGAKNDGSKHAPPPTTHKSLGDRLARDNGCEQLLDNVDDGTGGHVTRGGEVTAATDGHVTRGHVTRGGEVTAATDAAFDAAINAVTAAAADGKRKAKGKTDVTSKRRCTKLSTSIAPTRAKVDLSSPRWSVDDAVGGGGGGGAATDDGNVMHILGTDSDGAAAADIGTDSDGAAAAADDDLRKPPPPPMPWLPTGQDQEEQSLWRLARQEATMSAAEAFEPATAEESAAFEQLRGGRANVFEEMADGDDDAGDDDAGVDDAGEAEAAAVANAKKFHQLQNLEEEDGYDDVDEDENDSLDESLEEVEDEEEGFDRGDKGPEEVMEQEIDPQQQILSAASFELDRLSGACGGRRRKTKPSKNDFVDHRADGGTFPGAEAPPPPPMSFAGRCRDVEPPPLIIGSSAAAADDDDDDDDDGGDDGGLPPPSLSEKGLSNHMRKKLAREARQELIKHSTWCRMCGLRFSNRTEREVHERETGHNYRFQCTICDRRFTQKIQLTHHEANIHSLGKCDFVCRLCGRKFRNESSWKRHERNMGMHEKLARPIQECYICGRKLARRNKWAMGQHLRTHELQMREGYEHVIGVGVDFSNVKNRRINVSRAVRDANGGGGGGGGGGGAGVDGEEYADGMMPSLEDLRRQAADHGQDMDYGDDYGDEDPTGSVDVVLKKEPEQETELPAKENE